MHENLRQSLLWLKLNRRNAGALVFLLVGPAVLVGGIHSQAGYWLGENGDNLIVYRGGVGSRWDIAEPTTTRIGDVPPVLHAVLVNGIPVASIMDGSRLARELPHSLKNRRPGRLPPYAGHRIEPGTCLSGFDSSVLLLYLQDLKPTSCDNRHKAEVVALHRTPFNFYPGAEAVRVFAEAICQPAASIAGRNGINASVIVETELTVACSSTSGTWWKRGPLPTAFFEATQDEMLEISSLYASAPGNSPDYASGIVGADTTFSIFFRLPDVRPELLEFSIACRASENASYSMRVDTEGWFRIEKTESGQSQTLVSRVVRLSLPTELKFSGSCVARPEQPAVELNAALDSPSATEVLSAVDKSSIPEPGELQVDASISGQDRLQINIERIHATIAG